MEPKVSTESKSIRGPFDDFRVHTAPSAHARRYCQTIEKIKWSSDMVITLKKPPDGIKHDACALFSTQSFVTKLKMKAK